MFTGIGEFEQGIENANDKSFILSSYKGDRVYNPKGISPSLSLWFVHECWCSLHQQRNDIRLCCWSNAKQAGKTNSEFKLI